MTSKFWRELEDDSGQKFREIYTVWLSEPEEDNPVVEISPTTARITNEENLSYGISSLWFNQRLAD